MSTRQGFEAAEKARGGVATVLWCEPDRLSFPYIERRPSGLSKARDIEEMAHRDPCGFWPKSSSPPVYSTSPTWKQLQEEVAETIDSDYLRAEKEQDPLAEEVMLHNFGEEPTAEIPPLPSGRSTMVSGNQRNLPEGPENDPKVVFFSERTSKTRKAVSLGSPKG